MLGLADQVGGDVHRVGGVVGEDRDLGRAGLGVDADHAAQQPLRRGHVDVARAGDQVDRRARPAAPYANIAIGLGAADGVHLVDAEQGARGQDRGVRPAAGRRALRRAGQRDRGDTGHLGRARRSSPRWTVAGRGRRARTARPGRPGPVAAVTVPPGTTSVTVSPPRWPRGPAQRRSTRPARPARRVQPSQRGRRPPRRAP